MANKLNKIDESLLNFFAGGGDTSPPELDVLASRFAVDGVRDRLLRAGEPPSEDELAMLEEDAAMADEDRKARRAQLLAGIAAQLPGFGSQIGRMLDR